MKGTFARSTLFVAAWLGHAAENVYFVVGPHGGRQFATETNTFILPLSDPQQIKIARQLASTRGIGVSAEVAFDLLDERTPYFRIGMGSGGLNRAVWSPGEPFWSWHVKEFLHWASGDAILTYPYRSAQAVERAVKDGRLKEGDAIMVAGGMVVAELNPPMVVYAERVKLGLGEQHILYWTHDAFGENYVLEWTPALSSPAWQELEWTSVSRHSPSIVNLTVEPRRYGFFRLRGGP